MTRFQDNNRTVIVGGGCIGLSTAYNLAKLSSSSLSSSSSPNSAQIIIIETFDKPFAASSSTCTGCFHYSIPEPHGTPLLPLGKYSFDLWAAEADKADFRVATGYQTRSSFGIGPGSGQGLEKLPDWVHTEPSWDVDANVLGNRTATVNPPGLGKWLARQCLEMGIEFQTGWEAVGVSLSAGNKVQAVTCLKDDQTTTRIDCKQLLLACGPWTPTVYERLFPSSPIQLQWTTNAGDWII